MDNYSTGTGVAVVIAAVWSLIGIGVLVWYLWAMARLFPRIGLQARDGWIPFWNQWKLLERAQLPGWVVLLTFVGLGIVPGIMLIIAMYRLGNEYRAGVGYTVLGVFIPPLWATLFANHIGEQAVHVGATRQGAQYSTPQQGGFVPPQAPSAFAAAVAPNAAAPSAVAPSPAAPPAAQASPPAQSWPVSLQPARVPQGQQAPVAPPQASPLGGETEADYARLAAEGFQQAPAAPLGLNETPTPFSWTAARAAQEQAAPVVLPEAVVPPVHPLAPAAAPAAPAPEPVAPAAAPEPFIPAPAAPAAPAPAAPAPAAPAAPAPAAPAPAAPAAPVPTTPVAAAAQQAPAVPAEPVATPAAEPAASPVVAEAAPAMTPMAVPPAPTPAAYKATGITGKVEPLPDSMLPGAAHAATPVPQEQADEQLDLDQTIVAPRRLKQQWVLELPDGTELPLSPDTVVGRRPEAIEGSAVLAIADRTRTLSKSHVRLSRDGERWIVEDLNSTNGLVLLNEDGSESELMPGVRAEATERMLFGTLEVILRQSGDSA